MSILIRWVTKENLNSDSIDDTEDEVDRRKKYDGNKTHNKMQRRRSSSRRVSRANSSGPTTSDEENKRTLDRKVKTNTSTLESAQIDRAKSFEYFPGDSVPIQENSSSYEYLPGHMVNDRPGTVVSNYQGDELSGISFLTRTESSCSSNVNNIINNANKAHSVNDGNFDRELQCIAEELNERSKELLQAHMHKTKKFYKKMKRYIQYVSTPSMTPEDSRKKQEILDKLLSLMTKQESKLEAESQERSISVQMGRLARQAGAPVNHQSQHYETDESEPPTRRIETAQETTINEDVHDAGKVDNDPESSNSNSTMASAIRREQKVQGMATPVRKADEDIVLYQKRIEQMRNLRKEIKKLEKLEYAQLSQVLKASGGGLTFLNSDMTEDSSILSTSTCPSEVSSRTLKQSATTNISKKIKKDKSDFPTSSASSKRVISKAKSIELTSQQAPDNTRTRSGRPGSRSEKTHEKNKAPTTRSKGSDFGQTYPTPRDSVQIASKAMQTENNSRNTVDQATRDRSNRVTHVISSSTSPIRDNAAVALTSRTTMTRPKPLRKKKPVAYYLPMANESPLVIGKRIVKDQMTNNEVGKENRSILANYMAGVNLASVPIVKRRTDNRPVVISPDSSSETVELTLQDALAAKRPDFVARANQRCYLLERAKMQRLQQQERMKNWLNEVAQMSPSSRKHARPNFPPVQVQRIFNYREMIRKTREKYKRLPEVVNKVYETKKKHNYQTHRILKDMYQRRLQENVLKGRVSLHHYKNVVQY